MNTSVSGFGFLAGYVVMVGVASFLEKFSMKQLNPYQVNFSWRLEWLSLQRKLNGVAAS